MRVAFKEWLAVVGALGRGEQSVILRKGGIAEGKGGFQVQHGEFLLFPTLFHQQRERLRPAAQGRFDELIPNHSPDAVRLEYFARIEQTFLIEEYEVARDLEPFHILLPEVIEERFEWGRSQGISVLLVRVYRLLEPVELPQSPAYAGCKSWVDLGQEIVTEDATPVLTDAEFAAVVERFGRALPGGAGAGQTEQTAKEVV